MDQYEWPRCIKSARLKKRLVKTDRDKQLIQLSNRQKALLKERSDLPLIPLEHPYQRGWKRFFVLRDDVNGDARAGFYETLLKKINTVEYDADKSFKRKKRRRRRYGYVPREQLLRKINAYDWHSGFYKLTDEEKACFERTELYDIKTRRTEVKYVFAEPWRYALKITPNMVSHKKQLDLVLERELAWIDNHIENNYLWPRIHALTHGRNYRRRRWFNEPAKYINKIKNIPRYAGKEGYLALEL